MSEDDNEFEKFKLLYDLSVEEANKDVAMLLALVLLPLLLLLLILFAV